MPISWWGRATRLAALAQVVAWLSFGAHAAQADVSTDGLWGVHVSKVWMEPARRGENARLRARIDNFSGSDVSLIGVRTNASDSVSLSMNVPGEGAVQASGFWLDEDESLDLNSSHIEIQLNALKQDLGDGEWLLIEFVFQSGSVSTFGHVHAL